MTLTSWPQASPSGNRAKKVTTVVTAPMATGPPTARTPAIDAAAPCRPFSRCLAMLSPTTTASSTTMPVTMKNANSVSTLTLRPTASKNTSAPRNEIGMPMAIHSARRMSKTTSRVMKTSTAPMMALPVTVAMRSEMNRLSSCQSSMAVPGGRA